MRKTLIISPAIVIGLNIWQFAVSMLQRQALYGAPAIVSNPFTNQVAAASKTKEVTPIPLPAPTPAPAVDSVVLVAQTLLKAGFNPAYANLYLAAQAHTGTPWQLIAAVHMVETHQSGDTSRTSHAGATGPMQFMPATFRAYAMDGDGGGTMRISDVDDAIITAGRYLATSGADKGHYGQALYNYNHSNSYVAQTLASAHRLGL